MTSKEEVRTPVRDTGDEKSMRWIENLGEKGEEEKLKRKTYRVDHLELSTWSCRRPIESDSTRAGYTSSSPNTHSASDRGNPGLVRAVPSSGAHRRSSGAFDYRTTGRRRRATPRNIVPFRDGCGIRVARRSRASTWSCRTMSDSDNKGQSVYTYRWSEGGRRTERSRCRNDTGDGGGRRLGTALHPRSGIRVGRRLAALVAQKSC